MPGGAWRRYRRPDAAITEPHPADRRRRRRRGAAAGRRCACARRWSPRRCSMRSPARVYSSRPRPCSAPARSSSAAPITSSPRSRRRNAPAAWWRFRRAITPRASRRRRGCWACRRSSSCRRDAPRPKRERTAALGAEVVLYDRAREDRQAIARDIADAARRRRWCRPMTIRWSSRGRARPAARSSRIWRRRAWCPTWWSVDGIGRRADRRHRARGEGARAAGARSTPPSPRASTTMPARSGAGGASATPRSPARSAMR